ncbi:hypothetical protein NA57DRAFT_58228 [Rhizodiscina lignyota]|uniref:Extracellular membrane protein CFEM domain-containing protein n=1 Tax=Rhizodiscina lignyota TaxID=1504668 RepID=A0A9P4I6Z3_9PEZI|nr:hypothetical protein NA57DRAFT_58228 [Rhizodiscina lignyota]
MYYRASFLPLILTFASQIAHAAKPKDIYGGDEPSPHPTLQPSEQGGDTPPPPVTAPLGSFAENGGQTPFKVTYTDKEEWQELLEKVNDLLEAIDDLTDLDNNPTSASTYSYAYSTYTSVAKGASAFMAGADTVVTLSALFDPSKPSEACSALGSLATYCSVSSVPNAPPHSCACYSGSYYVPEQWNSLAERCADYSCLAADDHDCYLATVAADYTSYCSMNVNDSPSAAFSAPKATSATPTETTAAPAPTDTPSVAASLAVRTILAPVTLFFSFLFILWL